MKNNLLILPIMAKNITNYPNRINYWRKHYGLTLSEIARQCNSTTAQIGRLEKGERELTLNWMQRIASVIGVNAADLLPFSANPLAMDDDIKRLVENYKNSSNEGRQTLQSLSESSAQFHHREKITPINSKKAG